jgi:two-component system sensor histidine kinase KdpD
VEIDIALRTHLGEVAVSVSDRGPGIPPDQLDRIFDRFYSRRSGTAVGERASAGLGLTIARAIAHAHRGGLLAHNRATGGAVFVLTLPLAGGSRRPPTRAGELPARA